MTMSWPGRKLLVNFVSNIDADPRGGVIGSRRGEQGFQPPTDIYETADAIVVRVEIAGMTSEQINLAVDEDTGRLTVSGTREDPAREEPKRYFNVEIECGEFIRVVQLPRPVKVDEAEAEYDRGFLVVRLPIRTEDRGTARSVPIG